jgi:hypothetical protein
MKTISLPKGAKCKVVEINDLEQINSSFLKDKVNLSDRYTCIFYNNEVKHFAMILSREVDNRAILADVKESLATDIFILKQLYA